MQVCIVYIVGNGDTAIFCGMVLTLFERFPAFKLHVDQDQVNYALKISGRTY